MADFDPDKYLAEKTGATPTQKPPRVRVLAKDGTVLADTDAKPATAFDPDAYLREKTGAGPKFSPHVDLMEGQTGLSGALSEIGAGVGLGALKMGRSGSELFSRLAEYLSPLSGFGKAVRETTDRHWPEPDADVQAALLSDPKHLWATVPSFVPLVGGANITPGGLGNLVGEATATAPIGGLAGSLARQGLARVGLQALAKAGAAEGGHYLARAATKFLPLAAEGMAQGTVLGGPDNRLAGAIEGGLFAPTMGAALSVPGILARGFVKPSVEAAELMRRGVPVSVGKMNPGGALSKIEEAGMHSAMGGDSIEAAHQAGLAGLQRAAAEEVGVPGYEVPKSGPIKGGEFQDMYEAFRPAYEPIKAEKIPASINGVPTSRIVKDAFRNLVEDNRVMAKQSERDMVNRFLQDQATVLDKAPIFGATGEPLAAPAPRSVSRSPALVPASDLRITAPRSQWAEAPLTEETGSMGPRTSPANASGPVIDAYHTAEPLLSVREGIRDKLRSLNKPNSSQAAKEMLENAESLITDAINKRLGPEGAAQLRDIDAAYARYKILEDAGWRAGDSESGFTPSQLQESVKQSMSRSDYARGGGGGLRELSRLGRTVLENRAPRTGAIKQTLPLGLNHAAGPIGAFLNGPGREFALGGMPAQLRARTLLEMLNNYRPQGGFVPSANAFLAPLEVDRR